MNPKNHLITGILAAASLLGGCGMAETAAVTATQAEASAEQAKEAKKLEAKVEADIAEAQQAAADERAKAEAGSN